MIYKETGFDTWSTDPEEIRKALYDWVIPYAYKNVITDIKAVEVRKKVSDETETYHKEIQTYGTSEEMMAKAAESYFVRGSECNLVYCPNG